jgi:calcineurin-like phosphoesterase family protein
MPNTYVVSDWHLNHRNILTYCPNRVELFGDVEEMTAGIVERTLEVVGPKDTLYFLGDLTFRIGSKRSAVFELLQPLRAQVGKMHWIVGNHDEPDRMPDVAGLFDSVLDAVQFRVGAMHVFLSHYPVEVPFRDLLRLVSIHGHHHGTLPNPPGRIDVGIDSLYGIRDRFDAAYTCEPILLETAMELAAANIPAPFESEGQPTN